MSVARFGAIGAVMSLLLAGPAVAAAPAAAAESDMVTQVTNGGWVNEFCGVDHYDPTTGDIACWGATQFAGTWTGHTIAYVQGKLDLSTGDITIYRIDETFIGVASDGTSGTLHFLNRGYLDFADRTLYLESEILKGTGDWTGASGKFVFDGFMTGDATGVGGWHGTWTRPRTR
jgi:hypothetical protein